MTLTEWAIAYDFAFGREQVSTGTHVDGEVDFLIDMAGDLKSEDSMIVLLIEEYWRWNRDRRITCDDRVDHPEEGAATQSIQRGM